MRVADTATCPESGGVAPRSMSGLTKQKDDLYSDECLALLTNFMKVRDRKARA